MLAAGIGLGVLSLSLGTTFFFHALVAVGNGPLTVEAVRLSRTLLVTSIITAVLAAWCILLALRPDGLIGGG